MTPEENDRPVLVAVLLSCLGVLFIFLLHPRIGIRDVDGYSYIMGARSLHLGTGYRGLTGEVFNHWPPGYSLLLSPFKDPVFAAMILNYLSFGLSVGLLYYLLRLSKWEPRAALGFTLVLASGFFRLLANWVHPDILTYALFLAGVCLAVSGARRTWPGILWAVAIQLKFIAAVFLPAAFIADLFTKRQSWIQVVRSYVPAGLVAAIGLAAILVFNAHTTQTLAPQQDVSSLGTFTTAAKVLVTQIPRAIPFSWHGTAFAAFPKIAFAVSMLMALICLCSLRGTSDGKWLRIFGSGCLIFSGLLLFVRAYEPVPRLIGYGIFALVIGFRPNRWANNVWLAYGLLSLAIGVTNATTVNSLGSNDPRYAQLANEFQSYYKSSTVVATNSFHILDLHANIASVPVADYAEADHYQEFFWVTLPKFDATAGSVVRMPPPTAGWCQEREFSGGILFRRCT
jgi:hypothetical protein